MFGLVIAQDFILTPFLALLLQRILFCIFYREKNGKLESSAFGYIVVKESFKDCMFIDSRVEVQQTENIVTDESPEVEVKEVATKI